MWTDIRPCGHGTETSKSLYCFLSVYLDFDLTERLTLHLPTEHRYLLTKNSCSSCPKNDPIHNDNNHTDIQCLLFISLHLPVLANLTFLEPIPRRYRPLHQPWNHCRFVLRLFCRQLCCWLGIQHSSYIHGLESTNGQKVQGLCCSYARFRCPVSCID